MQAQTSKGEKAVYRKLSVDKVRFDEPPVGLYWGAGLSCEQ
tara:strand:+ start:1022 stop:1144 length:123 start_codon:yes stop_codon:yes gene_type:complete